MVVKIQGALGLEYGQTLSFKFIRNDGREAGGFVIAVKEGYRAYYNRCNHWPVELDQGDGDFYYDKIDRVTCKSHGATYKLEDGFCDAGPCSGSYLKKFALKVTEDEFTVDTGDV